MRFDLFRTAVLILSFAFGTSALAQTTVTLQQGLNGYAGAADSFIAGDFPDQSQGANSLSLRSETNESMMVRFKIFAAEGGPVPNGATITSATLSFYKFLGADAVIKASRLLKNWSEPQATWNVAATGTPWTTPGALSAGNDYLATADGQASVGDANANGCDVFGGGPYPAACFLTINVTSGVQAFAANPASNFGWKLAQVSSSLPDNHKHFISKEEINYPTVFPQLTIIYNVAAPGCDSGTSRPFDQAPISGAPIPLAPAGTTFIEAEHFNCGGEGQGYHDNTPGNQSTSAYRNPASVDVMDITTGGRTVQFFDTGEWMAYTISVATAGTYNVGILAASNQVPAGQVAGQYKIQIDGTTDVTSNVNVLSTGSWDSYAWTDAPAGIVLSAGTHTLRLVSVQQSFRVDQIRLVGTAPPASCDTGSSRPFDQAPINGAPIPVVAAGTTFIEAEHFNCGGEGQGYHDNTPGNQSTSTYRNPASVDIIDQTNGLRTVQFFDTGEWMVYTINVAASGTYTLGISAAKGVSGGGGGLYRIEIDGADATGNVPVPTTPDWETPQWVDASTPVSLNAGVHTLRLVSVQQSYRVDQLRLIRTSTGPIAQLAVTPTTSGTAPLNVTFNASGSADNGSPITGLRLAFGDGTLDATWADKNTPQPHTYNTVGSYTATLTATNANGTSAPVTRTITVTTSTGGTRSCGAADLCVNFEDTQFHTAPQVPPGRFQAQQITTTSSGTNVELGSLVWGVENKADCSDPDLVLPDGSLCGERMRLFVPGRDGGSAIRIATLDDDRGVSSTTQERNEISLDNTSDRVKPETGTLAGQQQWWAHSVFIPLDSALPGAAILQFHPGTLPPDCDDCSNANFLLSIGQKGGSPQPSDPLIFHAFTGANSATRHFGYAGHSQYNYAVNPTPTSTYHMIGTCLYDGFANGVETGVEKGVWYDFVHRIKWSNTNDGSHEIWMRRANGPVMKVLNQTGINTLYTDPGTALLKIGVYQAPLLGQTTSAIHDRIRRSRLSGAAGADAVRIMASAGVEEFRIDLTLPPDALGPGPFTTDPATKRACHNVDVKTCRQATCDGVAPGGGGGS